jgi:glycosyltransferase involved in cell wall biosynthesis
LKVSIIIPAYNEEKSIEKTIKSLLDQDYNDYEILVVNNNSKDRTEEIAKKYVRTINEEKQGYMHAVQRGIDETNGTLISICDADTIYPKNWLTRMVRPFEKNPKVVATYGIGAFADSTPSSKFFSTIGYTLFLWLSKLLGLDNTAGFNFVYKRDAYIKSGGYDTKWTLGGPDVEFGNRLKRYGKVKLVHTVVGTSSRRFQKNGFFKTLKMFASIWWSLVRHKKPNISYEEYNKTRK